jgi:hypothetical protein
MDLNWVWVKENSVNQYAEFTERFFAGKKEKAALFISAPTQYAVWLNGAFVAHGQYGDFPQYKVYDEIDATSYIREGENILAVLAYNQGEDSYAYLNKTPALAYRIEINGAPAAASGAHTRARLSRAYVSGDMEHIAPPLGFSLTYDFTREDDWKTGGGEGFEAASAVLPGFQLFPRPIKRPALMPAEASRIAAQGVFKRGGGDTVGKEAQNAWLSARTAAEATGVPREKNDRLPGEYVFRLDEGDGIYITIDMDKERAGYLTFDIESDRDCEAVVVFGEHLSDLRVRSFVGGRNFAERFRLKKGRNILCEYMRRVAGRYLMLYVYTRVITLREVTVRDYMYPFKEIPRVFTDGLKQRIYDTGRRTLQLCAHEHYEDCPGREQTLYAMDSRNQMLFGYGVFGETDMPRESIRLLSFGWDEKDGLLAGTAPGHKITMLPGLSGKIPVFSLYWIFALCEYYAQTDDAVFTREMLPFAERVMAAYAKHAGEKGFKAMPRGYFNYYEWSDGMEPGTNANTDIMLMQEQRDTALTYDCIPTALYALAAEKLAAVYEALEDGAQATKFRTEAGRISPLTENFYDKKSGIYFSYIDGDGRRFGRHEMTQSVVLYAGCGEENHRIRAAENLIRPCNGMVRATLSVFEFKYEGIIKALGERGLRWVIRDIEDVFGKMCFDGVTSYPEMEGGEKVFEDAASLCHGWSAVPCYIYNKYLWA